MKTNMREQENLDKSNINRKFRESMNYVSCTNHYQMKESDECNGDFFKSFYPYLERFDNVIVIKSLKEYVQFINSLLLNKYSKEKMSSKKEKKFIREKYIFRGISKEEHIKSTLRRYYDKTKKHSSEFEFIRKFEENGSLKLG